MRKVALDYIALAERLRMNCVVEMDLPYDGLTRGVSPYTAAMRLSFRAYIMRLGRWRDCMRCPEDWRKLKVQK